jgi:hypothetical protein
MAMRTKEGQVLLQVITRLDEAYVDSKCDYYRDILANMMRGLQDYETDVLEDVSKLIDAILKEADKREDDREIDGDAYIAGHAAGKQAAADHNAAKKANPYPAHTDEAESWQMGWDGGWDQTTEELAH